MSMGRPDMARKIPDSRQSCKMTRPTRPVFLIQRLGSSYVPLTPKLCLRSKSDKPRFVRGVSRFPQIVPVSPAPLRLTVPSLTAPPPTFEPLSIDLENV